MKHQNIPAPLTEAILRAAARGKVERANELIEQAQRALESACAELSGLQGGHANWKACHALTDKVQAFWWRIHHWGKTDGYRLDPDNMMAFHKRFVAAQAKAAEAKRLAGEQT